jgi:hypothetical protein
MTIPLFAKRHSITSTSIRAMNFVDYEEITSIRAMNFVDYEEMGFTALGLRKDP